MKLLLFVIMASSMLAACRPLTPELPSTPVAVQQPLATSTELSEESVVATERARAAAIQTAGALTRAAQPTFTAPPTFTPISANLPTLTPVPNSTPAGIGVFLDVPPDVLGSNYEIQNAYYFDRSEGRARYEIYAGALSGFRDADTAQGVVVMRVLQITEKDGVPSVEVVATDEFLTRDEQFAVFPVGPVRINSNSVPEFEEDRLILESTSQGFSWIFVPTESYLFINSAPPRARLEIGEQIQMAGIGGYCWLRSCADGGAISTSPTPLVVKSNIHLHLPLIKPPDTLALSAMPVSAPGALEYDFVSEDRAEWLYAKSGREQFELGALPLRRDQDIELALEPGYYVLMVVAAWKDYGDARYGFLVEVQG